MLFMYFYCYVNVFLLYVYVWLPWLRAFPCFLLSCKPNARVKPAKTGHGPHSSSFLCCSMYFLCCSVYFCVVLCIVCFVSFSVLFVCICVLNYCHRVTTQLQLNISYHISCTISYISYIISHHIISSLITSYHIYRYIFSSAPYKILEYSADS